MKVTFVFAIIVLALVAVSGCTQTSDMSSGQTNPAETRSTPIPAPVITAPVISATPSMPEQTWKPTTIPTTKSIITPTVTLTSTPIAAPESSSFLCEGDNCGTLNVRLSCNPKIVFKRMTFLQIKYTNNTIDRSAAVAAMGNNFADILPDGSVTPVKIKPGRYTLILLDDKNVQVPDGGGLSTMGTVSVTSGKITSYVFKEKC
jgi:hypothetical protein